MKRLFVALAPAFLLAAGALSSACSSGSSSGSGGSTGDPSTFVAYEQSFTGFQSWSSAPATAPGGANDGLHGVGPLTVYLNQPPTHGATAFPVGTIIVKETQDADVTQRIVFAMVKRGGGYNADGASGWEWFSLQNNTDGTVNILWRGVVPPAGETYANQAIGDCNGCHVLASGNDSVWDSALQLSTF